MEETFPLHNGLSGGQAKAGDGIYCSATISSNKKYYGVMIDQAALKEASILFFKVRRVT